MSVSLSFALIIIEIYQISVLQRKAKTLYIMSLIYNSLLFLLFVCFLLLISLFYAANIHKNSYIAQKYAHFFCSVLHLTAFCRVLPHCDRFYHFLWLYPQCPLLKRICGRPKEKLWRIKGYGVAASSGLVRCGRVERDRLFPFVGGTADEV